MLEEESLEVTVSWLLPLQKHLKSVSPIFCGWLLTPFDDTGPQVWEGATAAEVGERIAGFLEKKAISKAVVLVEAAKEAFADSDIFGGRQDEMMEQDEEEDEEGEEEARAVESMVKRLRLVFLR